MRIDDYVSQEEIRLIETLKDKNRMEVDEILYEYERKAKDGKL